MKIRHNPSETSMFADSVRGEGSIEEFLLFGGLLHPPAVSASVAHTARIEIRRRRRSGGRLLEVVLIVDDGHGVPSVLDKAEVDAEALLDHFMLARADTTAEPSRANPKVTARKNAVDDDDDEYLRRQRQKYTEQAAPRLFAAAAAAASDPSFPAWRLQEALFGDTELFPTHGPGPEGSNYFFDSHGGAWRVAPPDAPGAQAFGPVGSSVPIPLSLYRRVRDRGDLETDEAGWEWINPRFWW